MTTSEQLSDMSYSGVSNTNDDQDAASLAISQALQMLEQEKQNGFGLPSTTEDNINSNGDELSMTQEFTMSPRRAENNTLSQVDFDQWMQIHAALEGNEDVGGDSDQYYDDEQYEEEYGEEEEHEQEPADVRSAWIKATQEWSSSDEQQSMDVDDDLPISIASSEDDGESNDYEDDAAHEYAGQTGAADNDSNPFAASAALFLAGLAEQAAAIGTTVSSPSPSATLRGFSQENMDAASEEGEQPRGDRLPLQKLPPLDEMSKAINESLDRSNKLANDLYSIFDEAAVSALSTDYTGRQNEGVDTQERGTSPSIGGYDLLESAKVASEIERIRADSSAQQDKLSAELVKLSTELFQMDAEKYELCKRVAFLEKANSEHQRLEEEVDELKDRLSASNEELKTTVASLSAVERERNGLVEKCASLELQVGRLQEKQALKAQESNLSEQDSDKPDSMYTAELRSKLLKAQNRERLLLSTNRALEARLGDALRKLAEPVEPMDILTDHRRHWDAQLVQARSEATAAKESLVSAEQNLENEKISNERLRIRVLELESITDPVNVTPRKRKVDSHSDAETVAPPPSAAGSMSQETLVTTIDAMGGFEQAVVDAGEAARSRRRKVQRQSDNEHISDATTPTTTPRTAANRRPSSTRTPYRPFTNKPVTPRIHLDHVPASIRSVSKQFSDGRSEPDTKENMISRPGTNMLRRGSRTLEYRML
ncbi:hypothetical protein EV175_002073 [Coemansia sp. RSA 1933]|nr:hypothetical protein EV175_002073 [Coemansia sp. RSA 1933]